MKDAKTLVRALTETLDDREFSGMTVAQLIEELQQFPADARVGFSYNYGDRARTEVVDPVRSVGPGEVQYSDYHSTHALRSHDDEEGEEAIERGVDPHEVQVVVLSARMFQ